MERASATSPDPFLFPPETSFRFYGLVAALFGAFTFIWMWFYLAAFGKNLQAGLRACLTEAKEMGALNNLFLVQNCTAPVFAKEGVAVLSLVALTGALVLLVHLTLPLWHIRLDRMRRLYETADAGLIGPMKLVLDQIAEELGFLRPPTFLVRFRNATGAFAFGHWFRSYVCLDAGLLTTFVTDEPMFWAKVRHELAHFRNKDTNKTGLTTASWLVFIIVLPLVLLFTLFKHPDYETSCGIAWRLSGGCHLYLRFAERHPKISRVLRRCSCVHLGYGAWRLDPRSPVIGKGSFEAPDLGRGSRPPTQTRRSELAR